MEDRAPTFPSSGNQRLGYSRQDYPQFRFCLRPIVHKNPTKKFRCPRTLVLALQFRFSFALLILCLWSSLVAGLDFVLVVVQLHRRCFVSAAIPSTVIQITSRATTLLDFPSLAALCEFSPYKP
jgi:hypothetical protein